MLFLLVVCGVFALCACVVVVWLCLCCVLLVFALGFDCVCCLMCVLSL